MIRLAPSNREDPLTNQLRFAHLCVFFFALGCIAQDVPPPPKPTDGGPSLETTLKFISDKIADEGKLSYAAAVSDTAQPDVEWTNKFQVELSKPTFNTAGCRITFHWHAEVNGKVADDKDYTINFGEVSKIQVMSQEDNQQQVDSRSGHDSYQSKITPPLFVLVAKRPKQMDNVFLFSDEELANRVAKAMVHAVELCGKSEPF